MPLGSRANAIMSACQHAGNAILKSGLWGSHRVEAGMPRNTWRYRRDEKEFEKEDWERVEAWQL
jgi:hypothetical protein